MTTAIRTLAKVDLHCHFDGALPWDTLARLAAARGWPEAGDPAALRTRLASDDAAGLLTARDAVRSLVGSFDELMDAASDLARKLMAEAVVHVELVVDPLGFAAAGLTPEDALLAVDQGLARVIAEDDEGFLSWTLLVGLERDLDSEAALAVVERALRDRVPRLGGVVVLAERRAGHTAEHLRPALERAKAEGLGLVVEAGDVGGPAAVQEALGLGPRRVVGAASAWQDPDLALQLRAHRTPVVVCPSAQVRTGAARSLAAHPVRKMKDAGLFVIVATGWPTLLGTSLTGELEAMSKHHGWRLDDLRNATTRAVEAAIIAPNLRFQLARTIEIWRHRPMATPEAGKGDNWSL